MFYSDNGPVYTMKQMIDFIEDVKKSELPKVSKRKRGESYNLFNVPCAFDIETTSYYMNKTKCAWMYIWMFCINGISIYGRTFEEYLLLMSTLQVELGIDEYNRLVCYPSQSIKEVDDILAKYEMIAKYICVYCGRPAEYITKGYIASLCEDCWKDKHRHEKCERLLSEHEFDKTISRDGSR